MDSAVLLHMIAEIDRNLPILFLDTGKHFVESLRYRDAIVRDFGITDVRIIHPLQKGIDRIDPAGVLHTIDSDACCDLRKVEPMARAVGLFGGWFTGRKRFQDPGRVALPVFEAVGRACASIPWLAGRGGISQSTCALTICGRTRLSLVVTCRSAVSPARSQ